MEITLSFMEFLHKMLLANIGEDIAGCFRREGEWVRVGEHIVKRIAQMHLSFEHIHPFCDGNGRIGRVLNNYALIREGYVPINITFANRSQYYDAFKEFQDTGKTSVMEEIIGRAVSSSYHKRLAYLEGKKIITLNQYAKNSRQSPSNLINKAYRQTIPAFLEKGKWKIGV